MSDELDKFVLQYSVELKDSVQRLETLQKKMSGVQDGAKKGASEIKNFAAGASSELGKLVPGLNAVSSAVRSMGAEFAIATAALGALALGVKSVMTLREQYNGQRKQGMELGVSGIRLENYQRAFVRASGGNVGRDATVEGLKQFSGMANAAYADPTRTGREARMMKYMLGVDVGQRGSAPNGLNAELTQLATGLQSKSTSDVQGIAKATGLSQDWLLTVQRLGPEIGKIRDLTDNEIQSRQDAEKSLAKLNAELAKFTQELNTLEVNLGQGLLPAADKFLQFVIKLTDTFNKAFVSNTPPKGKIVNGHFVPDQPSSAPAAPSGPRKGHFGPGHTWIEDPVPAAAPSATQQAAEDKRKAEQKKADEKRDQIVDAEDQRNKQGVQTANEMALAVNMFASAVQSFSSAVDIRQAWAAWAGEVGKANGLPGSSGASGAAPRLSGGGYSNWLASKYSSEIDAASKKYGVDPQMIHAIMMTESHGDPNAVSGTGAGGLMQITRGNQKAYGLKNYRDPATNIDTGTRIYKEFLDRNKGDVSAALRGYNGNSDPNYVSKVSGFYGGNGAGFGESREKMQLRSVQQAVADWLHVPLDQIQRGGVTKGDAGWATRQIDAGLQNNVFDIKRQLATGGLPAQSYAKLQQELLEQSRGLDLVRQYQSRVVGAQMDGAQSRTIGEMPIIININGVTDPKAVGAEVNNQMRAAMKDVLMSMSNGIKG